MKKLIFIFFIIFIFFYINIYPQNFYSKRYTSIDGLLQNTIRSLMQDDFGRLWIGTSEGLSIFDGTDFSNYTQNNGLNGSVINSFFKIDSTTMWVSVIGGGISIFHKSKLQKDEVVRIIKGKKYFLDNTINAIFKDSRGRIWFCTDSGITMWSNQNPDNSIIHNFNSKNDPYKMFIYSVTEDNNGNIWFGSNHGLIKYDNHKFKFIKGIPRIVNVVKAYRDNKIWLGTDKGIFIYQNGIFKRLFKNKNIYSSEVNDIYKDKDGDLWFATTEGLYLFNGKKLINFNTENGIGNKFILSFLIDSKGIVWIGTEDGLNKITSKNLYYINTKYKYSYLWELLARPNNIIFAATKDGLYKIENNKLRYSLINLRLPSKTVTRVLFKNNRIKWVATSEGLVEFYSNGRKRIFTKKDGFDSNYILSLIKGGKDSVWVGTKGYWKNPRGRVYLIKNDKVIQPPTLKNLPPDPVTTLFKDSHNNIWIGFSGKGLYKLSRNKLISFSSKGKLPTSNIRNILEDKSGNIWIMTRYKGVYKYSNGKFINYSVKNGLNSNWVLSGVQDKEGTIWFNTDKGVSGYDGKIFRKLTYGGELMSGEMWASAVDQKGKLWFANSNYIFILKPNRMKKVISNSKLYIENFLVNDKRPESDFYSTHTLNFNENTVEIYFNCVNYFNGLKIKYRYKLVGLTKNWSIATTRNYIKFHNLSPGEYKFIVSSKLPGNNWCEVNSDVSFIIEAPFWQRIWFLILSSIAFIGSILLVTFLIYRYKLNQFLKIQQMREQIASDLHDDIGTNLTTISILSDIAKNKINIDTEKVYNFLDKIGNNARQVIDSMSDIVWVIKPGTDSLDMLIEKLNSIAFEILQIKGIQIDFKCDKRIEKLKLSMDVRKNLLLLFKEIINNIVKHSNASTVKILFSLKTSNEKSAKRLILMEVTDDGKGFDTNKKHNGNGLKNMTKRAAQMKARIDITSKLGKGTSIRLTLPVN